MKLYVMSDIHGMFNLLEKAYSWILDDKPKNWQMIFLGDYIDRGPQSADVVEFIKARQSEGHIALMGNHDQMMAENMPGWNDPYGYGKTTLKSYKKKYGYPHWPHFVEDQQWMMKLPKIHQHDEYVFVHAGIDPTITLDQQSDTYLLWIREPFLSMKNPLPGRVVVHGHTPCLSQDPGYDRQEGRINIDGGAPFRGGQLNVLVIDTFTEIINVRQFKDHE